MSLKALVLLAALPFVALGARQRRAATDEFQLYGYGPKLGGLPLFYADGFAYLGDSSLSNSSDAATVIFTKSGSTFLGSPNTTSLANTTSADWSNATLYIPTRTATDRRVGFVTGNTSTTDIITDRFLFYGSTAIFEGEDGSLQTFWTGVPVGNTGVYQLYWNATSVDAVQLTMRNVGPSNPDGAVPPTD